MSNEFLIMMTRSNQRITLFSNLIVLVFVLFSFVITGVLGFPSISLLDGTVSGTSKSGVQLQLQSVPNTLSTTNGIVTIIRSPGTPSSLLSAIEEDIDEDVILTLVTPNSDNNSDGVTKIICRGAVLQGTTDLERASLAFCSVLSDSIIVDGVTVGDIPKFRNSRHARTLTALFRSRLLATSTSTTNNQKKQTLIIAVEDDNTDIESLKLEIVSSFVASAAEKRGSPDFTDLYDLRILSDTAKVLSEAIDSAKTLASSSTTTTDGIVSPSPIPIGAAFATTWTVVSDDTGKDSIKRSLAGGLDPPHIAQAFVDVMNAHAKYTQRANAQLMQWRKRISRGLWIDSFGKEVKKLRQKCLEYGYDTETLAASGLPQVGQYRYELRTQLQTLFDTAVIDLYNKQVMNIQSSTVRRFQSKLLKAYMVNDNDNKNTYEANEATMDTNAALLRQHSYAAESVLDEISYPPLGLTKEKALRTITSALNDALLSFPDSPAAKIKRTQSISKIVSTNKDSSSKKKKQSSRSIGLGLDLVAMIRPDGFGTLQGFAGYSLPGGNTITVGIHNDADDPQVIAQFGGVRPPLLRIQPKLRIDAEL